MKTEQNPPAAESAKLVRFVPLKRSERIPAGAVGRMSNGDFLPVSGRHVGGLYSEWPGAPLGRLVETKAGKAQREASEARERLMAAAPDMLESLRVIGAQSPGSDWTVEQAFKFMRETARATYAKATGKEVRAGT
jgi:hypothetical protein